MLINNSVINGKNEFFPNLVSKLVLTYYISYMLY